MIGDTGVDFHEVFRTDMHDIVYRTYDNYKAKMGRN